VLPCSAFYPTPTRGRDGLSGYCRICTAGIVRERYRRRQGWLPGLADAAGAADGLAVRKRRGDYRLFEPVIPDLPPAPDFSRGLCSTLPSQTRAWWSSDLPSERKAAALACAGCPVLAPCEAWALSVTGYYTSGVVYGGMTPAQLRRRRRALLEDVAAAVRG